MSRRVLSVVVPVVALLFAGAPDLSAHQEPIQLDRTTAIERRIELGEEHHYRLALASSSCATVIVEQRGVDVVVRASRGGGQADTVEFQEEVRPNGDERIDIVTDQAGDFTLAIASSPGVYSGTYAIRVADVRPATAGDRSLYEARRLRTAARELMTAAKPVEARPMLERALSLAEAERGPEDPLVGMVLLELTRTAIAERDDGRAEPLCRRAIAIFDAHWGASHPYSALSRSLMAQLLQHAGRGPDAEALIRPAIESIAVALGPDHSWVASGLLTHAGLRLDAGDRTAAEAIYRRAIATLERVGDTSGATYARALNNLGLLYLDMRDLARAEELYTRALKQAEAREGPESFNVSVYLQNLGIVARQRKDYAGALAYGSRALAIRERILGAAHVDIAPLLNNLAILYRASGDVPQALAMFQRSLSLYEKALGPYHRSTLLAVGNIARTYAETGELSKAIAFQRRADTIIEKQLELNLAAGSEQQKLAFVKSMAERTDRTVSLHLQRAPEDADAAALAALVVLQRKGRVLDAMTDTFAAMRRHTDDGRGRLLFDAWNTSTRKLARLVLEGRGQGDDRSQPALADLEAEKERLEVEIAAYSAGLRSQIQPVTLSGVTAAIPDDAALIEFTVYRPFDPAAQINAEAYGQPRYAAYLLRKNAATRGVDLGPAAQIDNAVRLFRGAVRDRASTNVKARARALYDLILRPLGASLRGASHLLFSPDGSLALVPFEALADEHGRYLLSSLSITYLDSGRDLLRTGAAGGPHGPPVIVADPSYDMPVTGEQHAAAPDDEEMYFAPLANTTVEAREIDRLFPAAVLLTGPQATKAAVTKLEAPRMLHVASHAFFVQDDAPNPLLRTGIALSGANRPLHHRGDGVLTALEASGLNLWGTQLVTLSACDTGVGDVRNGEGVYGLRRAFSLAGAETLVMSLWPVSDYVARQTMVAYYTGLKAGLGRGEALRRAKIAIRSRKGLQHPFYWASFIQSGEWAALDRRH